MSRVLKFRAWHHGAGDPRVTPFMRFSNAFGVLFWSNVETDDLGVEVMQFTGLTDRNGKDIFESDIIKDDQGYNRLITIDEFGIDADGYETGDYYTGHVPESFPWSKFEVIGNLYQNEDLLNANAK